MIHRGVFLLLCLLVFSAGARAADEAFLAGLTAEERAFLEAHPVIRVGGETDWAPYDFVDAQGRYQGIAADYLAYFGEKLGVKLEVRTGPTWNELLDLAREQELDMLPALWKTPEREEFLEFTVSYSKTSPFIFTRDDRDDIRGQADLAGKRIAAVRGYATPKALEDLDLGIEFVDAEGVVGALRLVIAGRADAFIGDTGSVSHVIVENSLSGLKLAGDAGLPQNPLFMGVRKDWPVLAGILSKLLSGMTTDAHQAIRRRWIRMDAPARRRTELVFTDDEREWLAAHPVIRLGADPDWPPIDFVEDGVHTGIAADTLDLLEQRLGIRFELVPDLTWPEVLDGARNRSVDVVSAIAPDDDRRQYLLFTREFIQAPQAIFTRIKAPFLSGLNALAGERTAVVKGYFIESLIKEKYPKIILVPVGSVHEGVEAVSSGKVFAFVGNLTAAGYAIQKAGLSNLKVAATTDLTHRLHLGVRKDWPELHTLLDKALSDVTPDERNEISRRWTSLRLEAEVDYTLVLQIGAVVLVILIVIFVKNRQMAGEIRRRREAEKELSENRRFLQTVMDSQEGWVLTTTGQGLRSANRALLGFYGVSSIDEFHGKHSCVCDTFEPDETGEYLQKWMGTTLWVEHVLAAPDRSHLAQIRHGDDLHTFAVTAAAMEGMEEDLVTVVLSDVTELKRIEDELDVARAAAESANAAKSDFLANMSHEIRTPMNAVIGLSHLALQTELDAKQHDYLRKIHISAQGLLGLINDILDFSKIEAGKLDMESIPFDLHSQVLENLGNLVGLKAAEKSLEFVFDFDVDLPFALVGDPLRLSQVLINLMNNSLKFTEQGAITLRIRCLELEEKTAFLRFEIEDTGIGMNEEQRGRMFQSFSQADTSTTRKFGGTGLGLAISKRLSEMMGGEIGVESVPGEGSTFWFTARFGRTDEATVGVSREMTSATENLRVLLVDDNPTARVILGRYLTSFGYSVVEAVSGRTAVQTLEESEEPFDLVVMDWKMPDMDGILAAQRIRESAEIEVKPQILMVTAYDRSQLEEAAEGLPLAGVLVKPVSQSTLLDGILMAFGQPHAAKAARTESGLGAGIRGAHLLLMEDNEINQQVAYEILENAGVRMTVAGNGQEGLDILTGSGESFDGVLMDIQMPVMDGYEATREIRKIDRFADLPVIAMTANVMTGDREKAIEVGMNDQISKPVEVRNLFAVLDRWIHVESPALPVESPEPQETPPDVDLPEIPGVDVDTGLARVACNVNLYRKLLLSFRKKNADTVPEIRAALEADDGETATRIAHTVKGVAGNLAVTDVQERAEEVEAALRAGEEPGGALDGLADAIAAVVEALAALEPAAVQATAGPVDEERLRSLLDRLREMLSSSDTEALTAVEQLRDIVRGCEREAEVEEIAELVEEFDFDAALTRLESMQEGTA